MTESIKDNPVLPTSTQDVRSLSGRDVDNTNAESSASASVPPQQTSSQQLSTEVDAPSHRSSLPSRHPEDAPCGQKLAEEHRAVEDTRRSWPVWGALSHRSSRFTDPWCDLCDAENLRKSMESAHAQHDGDCAEQAPLLDDDLESGNSSRDATIPLGQNSWFTSMIQILMNTIGSTVVSLPIFLPKLGWVFSPTLLALAAVLSFGSGWIWSEVIDIYAERGEIIVKVGDIAAAALGQNHWITFATDWIGHFTIFASIIIILNFWTGVMFFMVPWVPYRAWMLGLVALFFLPAALIRNGNWISKFSFVGLIATIMIFVGMPVGAAMGLAKSDDEFPLRKNDDFTRVWPKNTFDIFVVFNTFVFMFGPTSLYPIIKAGMRDASKFNSANLVAHVLGLSCYLVCGLMCYAAFGGSDFTDLDAEPPVYPKGYTNENISFSMGQLEKRDLDPNKTYEPFDLYRLDRWWVGYLIAISMVFCCFVATPVRFLAFFGGMVKQYPRLGKGWANWTFRVATVMFVLLLTLFTPNIDTLIGLVSALVSPTLKFALPPLYYRAARHSQGKDFPLWMWGVVVFGLVLCGVGFVKSLINMVNVFSNTKKEGFVFGDFFGVSQSMHRLFETKLIKKLKHKCQIVTKFKFEQ